MRGAARYPARLVHRGRRHIRCGTTVARAPQHRAVPVATPRRADRPEFGTPRRSVGVASRTGSRANVAVDWLTVPPDVPILPTQGWAGAEWGTPAARHAEKGGRRD